MFYFLSGLIESRDKWLQQSNTVVNTAPYLNPDLRTKLVSNPVINPISNK
jgi:hypothetical protein